MSSVGQRHETEGHAYGAGDTKLVQWLWKDGLEHIMSLAIRIVEWGPLRLCGKTDLGAETSVCHTSITSFLYELG